MESTLTKSSFDKTQEAWGSTGEGVKGGDRKAPLSLPQERNPCITTRKLPEEVTNSIARKGQGAMPLAESRGRASGERNTTDDENRLERTVAGEAGRGKTGDHAASVPGDDDAAGDNIGGGAWNAESRQGNGLPHRRISLRGRGVVHAHVHRGRLDGRADDAHAGTHPQNHRLPRRSPHRASGEPMHAAPLLPAACARWRAYPCHPRG